MMSSMASPSLEDVSATAPAVADHQDASPAQRRKLTELQARCEKQSQEFTELRTRHEIQSRELSNRGTTIDGLAQTQRQIEDGELEEGEIFEGTMEVDSSTHSAPLAGSSAVAKQSADYFTSYSTPNTDSSAATNAAADDQIQEALDSQLGVYRSSNVKHILEQDFAGFQSVKRQNRGPGRDHRGQSRGQGHFQGRAQHQGRGQSQGQGQVQDQGSRVETKYPIVGVYSLENVQKAKNRIEFLKQQQRKQAVSANNEIPVALRSSGQPTDGYIHRRDSATPALDYTQVIKPPRLIRAAVKVGDFEVIGNAFTATKNYFVKVTFDGGRDGQASIFLRFRINRSLHVEERDVSSNENDVWIFRLQFKISTAGRRDPAIQQFECFSVNKAFPKSKTEEALIRECEEGKLNRFTSINLEVLRIYNDIGEPPSMQDLAKTVTDTNLLQTLQALLTELQAPLKLQIWFAWKEQKAAEDLVFKYMRNLFDTTMT